ncbi:MAG: GerMN domain-containing protein [Caloramator sp.]|nr:GerMN domain-containing protein [Caloramator sp.]
MKKYFIFLLLTLSFFIFGCRQKEVQTYDVRIVVYEPGEDNYLRPMEVVTKFKNSLEETCANYVIDHLKKGGFIDTNIKLKSIKKESSIVYIKLNREIGDMNKDRNLALYSIINTITEVPMVEKVVIRTNKGEYTYNRNRSLLKRDKNLNPSQVLKKQMDYEKEGEFFSAYLLMADESSNNFRKSYDDYYREMMEVYSLGFTNQEFRVGDYSIEGNTAKVKVTFFAPEGDVNLQFKCVNIDGVWMVDWLTSQTNL